MKKLLTIFLALIMGTIFADGTNTESQVTTKETPKMSTEVIISTNKGDITVRLNEEKAPITVANFLSYVDAGFYTDTIFHRVIKGFMIQGGGFTEDFAQKSTKKPIKNEAQNGLSNKRGTIAMARTSVIDSATAQFFINTVDNTFLDFRSPDVRGFGYAVFGEVISGMEVVDKIESAKTGVAYGMRDVPEETVVIKSIMRKSPANEAKNGQN